MKTIIAWLTSSACTHDCNCGRACTCAPTPALDVALACVIGLVLALMLVVGLSQ